MSGIAYFQQHQDRLEKFYPGINSRTFLQFFEDFKNRYPEKNEDLFFSQVHAGTPFQYILNETAFFRSTFYTTEDVLIPRSETEILVEEALKFLNKVNKPNPRVIDVGTGSGCVGLTIAMEFKNPLHLVLSDVCKKALEVSRRNYFLKRFMIHPKSQVDFFDSDRFQNIEGMFDFIVSNPPYIKSDSDRKLVHEQVLKYEPHRALFLNDDEYHDWFELFFKQVDRHLVENGVFLMEGHEEHLALLKKLAENVFSKTSRIEIKQDYTKRDRFLILRKSNGPICH